MTALNSSTRDTKLRDEWIRDAYVMARSIHPIIMATCVARFLKNPIALETDRMTTFDSLK